MKTLFTLLLAATCVLAAPVDFNATTGYGMRLSGGVPTQPFVETIYPGLDGPFFDAEESEIAMENIVLASEVDELNGFTRLGFTLTLRNKGDGYYEEVLIEWEPPVDAWKGVRVGDAFGFMPDLLPNATSSRAQAFEVRVPTADAPLAKLEILAGKHLRPAVIELFQFKARAVAVDLSTDDAFETGSVDILGVTHLTFTTSTPLLAGLQVGDLLVESAYAYTLARETPGDDNPFLSDYVAATEASGDPGYIPAPTNIFEVTGVAPGEDPGSVVVSGRRAEMMDVLDVGTFHQRPVDAFIPGNTPLRDIFRPKFGSNFISASNHYETGTPPNFDNSPPVDRLLNPLSPRGSVRLNESLQGHPGTSRELSFGLAPIHVPFNNVEVHRGIRLDGEMLLDAVNVEIKFRVRRNLAPKVTIKLSTKAEVTMRLSVGAHTKHLVEEEKSLFPAVPLPAVVFSIGPVPIEIAPLFKAKVGVTVDSPTNIVIPVQGSYEAGCVMTWDPTREGDPFTHKEFSKSVPLKVSDPLLNDSLEVRAKAFIEAGLEVQINRTAGPYVGARLTADFALRPTEPEWYSLDFDFNVIAENRFSMLGFNIASPKQFVSELKNLARKIPGVALPHGSGVNGTPPGSFNPVSGAETRWARAAGLSNPGGMRVARVPGSLEDVFAASQAAVVQPPIMRLDAKGNVLWAKGANFINPQRLVGTADGGLVLATGGQVTTVLWMDGNGAPVAAREFQPNNGTINGRLDFHVRGLLVGPGGETYVAGFILTGSGNDPFLLKYDANRDLVFFKSYDSAGNTSEITDMAFHPSGDLLLSGQCDGPDLALTSVVGGLLMRLTPAGDFVWARRTLAGIRYNSVTTAPDGAIFTAGTLGRVGELEDWPTLLVARHEPAGGDVEKVVTIGENLLGVTGENGFHLEAGLTPFDAANKIVWTQNGLIVTGNTDLPTRTTRAPLVMCLTERLSVRWWTAHEVFGAEDSIFDLVPTEQGLFTAGGTSGFTSPAGDTRPALFSKLPLEGVMDFGANIEPHYLRPSNLSVPPYQVYYPGIATPAQGLAGAYPVAFAVNVQPHYAATPASLPVFNDLAIDYSAPLQRDPRDLAEVPFVSTEAADFTRTTATLRGVVDPAGVSGGTARFEWGTAANALTNTTPAVSVARTSDDVLASAVLSGLATGGEIFYRVRLDLGGSTYLGEILSVTPSNHAPIAVGDTGLRVPADTRSTLLVLTNDFDADGDALTISYVTVLGRHGTASISPDGKSLLYEPDAGYTGEDELSYKITDGIAEGGAPFGQTVKFTVGFERLPVVLTTVLAESGTTVPLDPYSATDVVLNAFGTPAIADDGGIAATASFRRGRRLETGIYFQNGNYEAALLARAGAAPSGMPGVAFVSFGDPAISPGGAVAFTAKVRGRGITPASDDGLWTNAGGGLTRIIAEGGTLPFLGTARVSQIASFSIRDGEILALLKLKPGNGVNATNDSALVRLTPDGNGTVLAREGSVVSATDPALVSRISALMPALGSNGHARTHGDGGVIAKLTTTAPKREKIVCFPDVCLTTNELATGFGAGVRWDKFGLPAIDTTGSAWTAHATLKLGGTTALTDTALIFHDATASPLTIIAQENAAAPDTTANFASFLDPLVNSDFNIAFTATLRGTGVTRANALGIWTGPAAAPTLTARTGSLATDASGAPLTGVTWKTFTTNALPGLGGGPIFLATLAGTGVTPANRTALFAQDTAGNVRQLLRTGATFNGKTIAAIALLNAANGPFDASRSFNSAGAIALRLTFTDRTQALVRLDVP